MAEVAHLAVVVGDENHRARLEAEGRARTFNELYASEYLDRVRRGEIGAARAYLGSLRHSSGADPWVLLEVVAARVLAVGNEPAEVPVLGRVP
jgi:hypothetical protein